MYSDIIFDLDGTLTNPKTGIINSVLYAINKLDIEIKNTEELTRFIGPPLQDSFKQYYNFSHKKMTEVVSHFRAYFSEKGIYENELYPGIYEMLEKLSGKGKKLYIATSKLDRFAQIVVAHFNLQHFFVEVVGADYAGQKAEKSFLIEHLLKSNKIKELNKVVMVGDRKYDIEGAQDQQIKSVAVLYGYGKADELALCNATHTVSTVKELELLLKIP